MTTITAAEAREALKDRFRPAVETFDHAREAMVEGRHAAENAAGEAVRHVRRHPLRAIAGAAAGGALFGCIIGFAAARVAGRCR